MIVAFGCLIVVLLVLDMEKAVKTLKSIKQDKIECEDLDSIMHALGLQLSQDEMQKALKYVTTNADGTLSMKDFMFALTNNRRFSEADRNRVPVKNLNSILENMGINLTEKEIKKALEQVTVDGKNYTDIYLSDMRVESSKAA
ncbi:hypothetical protein Chor_009005 [Crotalus horridus]